MLRYGLNYIRMMLGMMLTALFLVGCLACGKSGRGSETVGIGSGCLSPRTVMLSSVADTVEIVRIPFSFQRDRIMMLDSGFVVAGENSCLLLDRKGDSLRTIARKGDGADEYTECFVLNEHNGLVYITDRDGLTKVYTQSGRLVETIPSPAGHLDAVGVASARTLAGYRVNSSGNERDRMIFYNADTVFNRLPYRKVFGRPKGYFTFRRDGQFVWTAGRLLFKELLNDTIYEASGEMNGLHPSYLLKLDSLGGVDSLRYVLEQPETELFCRTPYVLLLGESRLTLWLSTVYSSVEWQKQVYATHCYDRKSGKTYSLELKMSTDDMGRQSRLLYDTTAYMPPFANWDNFFPEQMSVDGRHLIAFRGMGMDHQVLVIARLKEDPLAALRPVSLASRIKVFLPILLLAALLSGYGFFRYRKNERALNRISRQLAENEQALEHYRREQETNREPSAGLEQRIRQLEMKNEELRGYHLFMKLKAEPSYVFIGEKEYEHLCRVTDNLYRGFATRLRETYPELTKHDIETCCLLKAGLANRELSVIFNNTPAAITKSKNRIKKRIGLGAEVNLDVYLQNF
ncbi:hypothetical protein [uncultured Parabacteroides sp.]|uniref:hypothetical protein n=1 Tax=uncultured Parabacteroides sp. TaxID=512312 RepID=UPI0025FF96ED|nr:hypothetical protein [uncultured Parabacteroides sp.]